VETIVMHMREYMLGNVAIARGLLEGGVQVMCRLSRNSVFGDYRYRLQAGKHRDVSTI